MQIGQGSFTYHWIEHWARIPATETGQANGRTHGVVVSQSGNVLVFNQAQPGILRFNADGQLINAWGDRFQGAHGMTLVQENQVEYLWLVDQDSAEVVKTTLDGKGIKTLSGPPHPIYQSGKKYVPTWVAVNEERYGGNGDIWVSDGYGSFFIHRYNKAGAYLGSINGSEGQAGNFNCPHGIMFSYRHREPELYIADRGNNRLQVYDADGRFKRVIEDAFSSPCGFVFQGEFAYIPELCAGVTILDGKDHIVAKLGHHADATKIQGWPNLAGTEHIHPGKFNSPHGMAVAPNGDLYIVEWMIGGRITKLAKC